MLQQLPCLYLCCPSMHCVNRSDREYRECCKDVMVIVDIIVVVVMVVVLVVMMAVSAELMCMNMKANMIINLNASAFRTAVDFVL